MLVVYLIFSLGLMWFYSRVHTITLENKSYFVVDGRNWDDTVYRDMFRDTSAEEIIGSFSKLLCLFIFLPVYYVLFDMIKFCDRKNFITYKEFRRRRGDWDWNK